MEPKVSFVLPTRNRIEWVAESMQGLLQQTVKDIELVVVDDASSDGTSELLNWFADRDPRVRVIFNEKQMGAGQSRTIGHTMASAPIIGVCDDDDVYPIERAQIIIDWFEKHPESELVNFPYVRAGFFNEILESFAGAPFDYKQFEETGGINYFSNPTVAVRRESVLLVPYRKEEEGKTDDYQFVCDWIKAGKKIDFMPDEPVCLHRVLPKSVMSEKRGWKSEWATTKS